VRQAHDTQRQGPSHIHLHALTAHEHGTCCNRCEMQHECHSKKPMLQYQPAHQLWWRLPFQWVCQAEQIPVVGVQRARGGECCCRPLSPPPAPPCCRAPHLLQPQLWPILQRLQCRPALVLKPAVRNMCTHDWDGEHVHMQKLSAQLGIILGLLLN